MASWERRGGCHTLVEDPEPGGAEESSRVWMGESGQALCRAEGAAAEAGATG